MPEGTLHMNKKLDDVIKTPEGRYDLVFADGTRDTIDVVIGADGLKSRVRQVLLGEDNPQSYPKYSGEYGRCAYTSHGKAFKQTDE